MPLHKILVVDDDADIVTIAKYALERDGYVVVGVFSGEEALKEVGTFQPDLILLDVMMPNMDGVTTLQSLHLRPETAKIPIVFFTAKALPEELSYFKTMGAQGVIVKPFDPLGLGAHLQEIWKSLAIS